MVAAGEGEGTIGELIGTGFSETVSDPLIAAIGSIAV
jgi:hypothetical protein